MQEENIVCARPKHVLIVPGHKEHSVRNLFDIFDLYKIKIIQMLSGQRACRALVTDKFRFVNFKVSSNYNDHAIGSYLSMIIRKYVY